MKKLFILVLFFLAALNLRAQEANNDFTISYGLFSNNQILDVESDFLGSLVTGGDYNTSNSKHLGPILVSYHRSLDNHFSIGVTAGLERIEKDEV